MNLHGIGLRKLTRIETRGPKSYKHPLAKQTRDEVCSGLKENDTLTLPQRLIYLQLSLQVLNCLGGLGDVALLEQMCHWEWAMRFPNPMPGPESLFLSPSPSLHLPLPLPPLLSPSFLFLLAGQRVALNYSSSTMPACIHAPHCNDNRLTL